MRVYRSFFFGAIIFLLVALFFFFSSGTIQATTNCIGFDCSSGDDTLDDFVQGTFYAAGLSNVGNGGIQLLPMGLTSQWGADPHSLPGNRAELAAVIYHDIIYAIGGWDETNIRRSEIFSATSTIAGPLTASGWMTPTTLPTALGGLAAAISTTQTGGFLYVVGGSYDNGSGGAVTSTISYRSLNMGGAFIGSWQNNYTALPTPLVYANAVIRNGNLYVIGGKDNLGLPFNDSATVYRFPINSDGSLGAVIAETNTLASGRRSTSSVTWTDANGQDYLYVIGGQTAGDPPLKSVARTTFDLANDVNTFTETTNDVLLNSLSAHAAVQSNGRVFITGGNETSVQTPITKVYSSLIDPTGNLHNWGTSAWIATTPLLRPRVFHATVINSGGEVYVIGGYGDNEQANGTNTIYHGSTNGFGSQYAPAGSFTSRLIGLGTPENISEIDIGSTITGTASMTVQYRYGLAPESLSAWTDLPAPLSQGVGAANTYPIRLVASVIQYRALLTSTVSYDASPILDSFFVKYNTNLPDLRVVGMSALPSSSSPRVLTPTVIINNAGPGPLNRPTRIVSPSRVPPPLGRSSPRIAQSPNIFKFWVDLYIDRKPTSRTDLGDCFGSSQSSIAAGGTDYISIDHNGATGLSGGCPIPAGKHIFYAQVDTCDAPSVCGSFGYILESNENNNIGGPYSLSFYLPIINR